MVKISRIVLITLLIVICLMAFNKVYADVLKPEEYEPVDPSGYETFYDKAGIVLGVVRSIGAIVSVLGIAILGIRYMLASVAERANYKETMLPFIIGIAITVSITSIITIVQNIAENKKGIKSVTDGVHDITDSIIDGVENAQEAVDKYLDKEK